MPNSNFNSFTLKIPPASGSSDAPILIANATVKVWNVTDDEDLVETFVSEVNGVVAGGTLPVDVGTTVRFRCENDGQGRTAWGDQTTT
jgi:hypothetical protein